MDILKAALRCAHRGWAVFPVQGKTPFRYSKGHKDASTNAKKIRRWWAEHPEANLGIACDSSHGPIVVDIDGPDGEAFIESLGLPETRMAQSRAGRRHLYFGPPLDGTQIPRMVGLKPDGQNRIALDILGDGGYVIAPPSLHPETKRRYKWLNRLPLAPFPKTLLRFVKAGQHPKLAPALPDVIGEGERDTLMTSLAGSMRRRGASPEAILAALREENNSRCSPPLDDRQLQKIAHSIGQKEPARQFEHLTDLGNARRFIDQHHLDVRAIMSSRRPWYIWEGVRWAPDETGEIERRAKMTVRALYREASQLPDEDARDDLLKHASKSEGAARIRAMLELAATEPEISTTADLLDNNTWLFNVENGTLDLRTGKLRPHVRADLITQLAPVEYRSSARAPRWKQFLQEIFMDDAELIEYVQRAVGYTMTGETSEQCLFFCYGQGSNGKSTFFEVLRAMFGSYAQQADFRSFMVRIGNGPRDDLARMRGARFVTASEASHDQGFDTATIKQLTGGDTILARHLYERLFEFKPRHKLWLAANHKPMVREQTEAMWRRMRLLPFVATFNGDRRDGQLEQKLRDELPGILNWAVEGCQRWGAEGLPIPRAVQKATRAYRDENDVLGEFIDATCREDAEDWTTTTELYRVFVEWWTDTRGPRSQPFAMIWFTRMLSERPGLRQVKRGGQRGWQGIGVRADLSPR